MQLSVSDLLPVTLRVNLHFSAFYCTILVINAHLTKIANFVEKIFFLLVQLVRFRLVSG